MDALAFEDLHSRQRTLDRLATVPGVCYAFLLFPIMDASANAQTRASAAAVVTLIVAISLASWMVPAREYRRWRTVLVVLVVLGAGAVPHTRDAQVIPVWLREGRSTGRLATLRDVWRMLVGTRILNMLMVSFLMPLPLIYHVPLRISMILLAHNPAMCQSQLMHAFEPEIGQFHQWADLLLRPLRFSHGAEGSFELATAAEEYRCTAFIIFMQLAVGVLLTSTVMLALRLPAVRLDVVTTSMMEKWPWLQHWVQPVAMQGEAFGYLALVCIYQVSLVVAPKH